MYSRAITRSTTHRFNKFQKEKRKEKRHTLTPCILEKCVFEQVIRAHEAEVPKRVATVAKLNSGVLPFDDYLCGS